MTPNIKRRLTVSAICALSAVASPSLTGSGFILHEQSISGLGVGFSSGAAGMGDNSSMFFNPATLTMVEGTQVTGGIHLIMPKAEFMNKGSMGTLAPTQGPDATSDKILVVPNLYISRQLTEDLVVGLSSTTPYGLATSYDDGWVGRYIALETDLLTANMNLAFGYKVSERISFGGGVSACYGEAVLSNALNLGLAYLKAFSSGQIPANPETLALAQDVQANLGGTTYDGHVELTGDDVGYGFNFGVLLQPSETTRIGLHYRSKIKLDLSGTADFTVGVLTPFFSESYTDQGGQVALQLPDTAQISIHHYMTEDWAVMADIFHTWWSKFDELNIIFSSGLQQPPIPEKWDDSWKYGIGTTCNITGNLQLRGGLVIDESPVPGDEYRSPRIPDEDRLWISFGLGYQLSERFRLDVAYVHVLVDDPVIDNDTHTPGEHLIGTMEASVNLVSLGGSYSF